ncbi:MAG: DUF2784 domain-containing protein [Deltaproteobacteria bacterium]|nr:DUF2784 domain-containing protein [Deltaproteobacteria bacterium]
MLYRLSADGILMIHLGFVLFVVLGGFLVLSRPRLMWFHVPAVVWGVLVEFVDLFCPLTPLEVRLRELGGEAGYAGGFIEHYLVAVLYPSALTRGMQIALGSAALLLNAAIYGYLLRRRRRTRSRC